MQAPKFRLREGAPGRREYQRGGLPNLDAEDARVQALELFDVDVLVGQKTPFSLKAAFAALTL